MTGGGVMRRRWGAGLLGAAALVVMVGALGPLVDAAQAPAGRQPPEGASGRLLLPRNRDVWQLQVSSGAEQRLLSGASLTSVTQASWSPDGRQAAYSLFRFWRPDRPAGSDLAVVGADGGESTTVLPADGEDVSFTEPVWTPDGRSLVYSAVIRLAGSRYGETRNQVERVPAMGGERTVLVDDGFSPAVSRDGRQIAFLRAPSNASDGDVTLWVADADGRNPRSVLADPRFISLAFPRFAPGGDRLAFAAVGGPNTAPRASGALLPWLRGVATAHGLPWDMWEIRLDGSGLRRLTALAEDDPAIAWSPDGRWIAFQGGSGVHVLDAASTAVYLISESVGFGGIDWTP
jgi:Tol biopolymer transport system component